VWVSWAEDGGTRSRLAGSNEWDNLDMVEQATSQCSEMRWEMELWAGDKEEMSQFYVVDKRESVERMQERYDVSKNEQIHLESCIISGRKESGGKQR